MNYHNERISTLEDINGFDGNGKQALIFWGGWDGHEPELIANRIRAILEVYGMHVRLVDSQACLGDAKLLMEQHLIVPVWTMGEIEDVYVDNVVKAVGNGTGLAGCHGGMCDAFRTSVTWQFMTGGNWVSHPGNDGLAYTVKIRAGSSPIVQGLEDFEVASEQYYLHVDPAVQILAETEFPVYHWYHASNGKVSVPAAWTKYWGHGRVFYTSLGHHDDLFDRSREAGLMLRRGLIWAAAGKDIAAELNGSYRDFANEES